MTPQQPKYYRKREGDLDSMLFSLVLATVDRTIELQRFLHYLNQQSCRDFELIVVDQNNDDILLPILEPYINAFPIIHLRSSQRGASRARNLGMKYASGEIIGFPDDDCWYSPDILDKIKMFFETQREWDGVSGYLVNAQGISSFMKRNPSKVEIDRFNIWRRTTTAVLFLRKYVVEALDGYDEELGVGAGTPFGSAEDIDYPLQALKMDYRILHDPAFVVFHPDPFSDYGEFAFQRGWLYGAGMGRVLRKHHYPFWFLLYQLVRALGGLIIGLLRGNGGQVKYYAITFKGRIYGWRSPI